MDGRKNSSPRRRAKRHNTKSQLGAGSMYTFGKLAKYKTTVAVVSLASLMIGCDTESSKSDREIQKQVASAAVDRIDQSEDSLNKAANTLQAMITKETAATSAAKVIGLAALAQTEMEQANLQIQKNSEAEGKVQQLVVDLQQAVTSIGVANSLVDGYRKQDPGETVKKLTQQIADARGGPGKDNWVGTGNSPIRTQSALTQEISRLEGEIAKLELTIKGKVEQRDKALTDSADADAKSKEASGQESVDLFKKAAELRKQGTDLGTAIEADQTALKPLKSDLAVAKEQLELVNGAIAAMEKQLTGVQDGFKSIQQKIDEQRALIKAMVDGDGTKSPEGGSPRSVAEKGDALGKALEDARKSRDDADALLDKSAKHFADAQKAANDVRDEIKKKMDDAKGVEVPQTAAWNAIKKQFAPSIYIQLKADVDRIRGALHTSHAASATARKSVLADLKKVVADAKLDLPKVDSLSDSSVAEEAKTAAGTAAQFLDSAKGALEGIDPNSTHISRMLAAYVSAQLAKVEGRQKDVEANMDAARAERDAAKENHQPLPALPAELAFPPEATKAPEPGATPSIDSGPKVETPKSETPAPVDAEKKPAEDKNPIATPPAPGM